MSSTIWISGHLCVLADRVFERSDIVGIGAYPLQGTDLGAGLVTFINSVGSGNKCPYCARLGPTWERGVGTIQAGNPPTLVRTEILQNSSGNLSPINWPTTEFKDLILDAPTEAFPNIIPKVTVYTSSSVWTRDAKCICARIRGVGNGGAGGGTGATGADEAADAGGGAGGEYAEGWFSFSQLGASLTITIPAAANGGTGNGPNGGSVTVGSLISFSGGGGGESCAANSGTITRDGGRALGAGVGGFLRIPGHEGGRGRVVRGSSEPGSPNPLSLQLFGGRGGGTVLGGSCHIGVSGPGATGLNYGGGGSGAAGTHSAPAHSGGDGARGIVIFEEWLHA